MSAAEPFDQLDELIALLKEGGEPPSRERLLSALASLLDFHRAALDRVLSTLREEGRADLIERLLEDPLLESLLRGYDLLDAVGEPRSDRARVLLPVLPDRPDPGPGRSWHPLVAASEVEPDRLLPVDVFDRRLIACLAGGRIRAMEAACPQGGGELDNARLEGPLLTCPCHGLRFDLRSGRGVGRDDLQIRLLPVRVENGVVKVAW